MTDALERFFNWQSDMDWAWGPLLFLRPTQNVRFTLQLWLKIFGLTLLAIVPVAVVAGAAWVYYDYTAAQQHEALIPPVKATETWVNSVPTKPALSFCAWLLAFSFFWLFLTHWAWNRRADRLNRELGELRLKPIAAEVPGVWPPPPGLR